MASRSRLSMASSFAARSQSNIYLDDPDYCQQYSNIHNLPTQYSVSTMNMPSMVAAATSTPTSSMLKGATSMQQLKDSKKMNARRSDVTEQHTMMMDQDHLQQASTVSIPEIYEQQLMNERLMCIQQMMASGQNFASMFHDDPQFAQQIMSYMSYGGHQQQQEPEVIEIMDE